MHSVVLMTVALNVPMLSVTLILIPCPNINQLHMYTTSSYGNKDKDLFFDALDICLQNFIISFQSLNDYPIAYKISNLVREIFH